jgi:type IV pilus assembly protein PilW
MKRQQGVTLVELMVSMLVGMILLSGVVAVYIGSKQTYGARGGLSILQENGRIAIKRLQRGVLSAGYPKNNGVEPIISRADQVDSKFSITPSGDDSKGDILTVSFMPFGGSFTQDCLGQSGTTTKGLIVNNYFVQNKQLMCRGSGNTVAQPIAEAVDNMQVLYGIDTDNDGFANQYLDSNGAKANPMDVVSIQVALLINSIDKVKDVAPGAGNEDQFNLLGQNYTAPNDRLARRVFTTTIPLRNRMPLLQ